MKRNIVLIILDTVRKDYFDKFASRIKRESNSSFEQCRVAATWSTPSHASILTGDLLHKHGVYDGSQSYEKIGIGETFISQLSGYQSLCITDHGLLQPTYSFDKFFDVHKTTGWRRIENNVDLDTNLRKYWTALDQTLKSGDPYTALKNVERAMWEKFPEFMLSLPYFKRPDQGASELTRIAKNEINGSSGPFFLFMNYMDAHTIYRVNKHLDPELYSVPDEWENDSHYIWESDEFDEEYLDNYRELYGASIDYLDRKILELVSYIQNVTERETTFLITADHGHNLGYPCEDNLIGHSASVSEGVLHVPLSIINAPDGFSTEVNDYFSHLDLGELILRLSQNKTDINDIIGSPIFAEHEGLVGHQEKIKKFPGTATEFEYWNRMIRVKYDNGEKLALDSQGDLREYKIDSSRPCFQQFIKQTSDSSEFDEDIFSSGISEYKEKINSVSINDKVRQDLSDLGYL